MVPGIGGIIGFMGFGAIILIMWRTLRRPGRSAEVVGQPSPAPSAI